ncbi:MAG: MerR family transcriptional regulator [Acidimicrobiia bacterium]
MSPSRKPAKPSADQPMLDGMEPRPQELGFRGPQVCKIVGISYRQLDYWARTDLVRPSIADARGSGTQRTYSYRDLVRLKVVKSLLDAGVKLQTARSAIEYLKEDLGDDWASASLVLNGSSSVLARTGDDLVDLVRRGQGVLNIVPLGHVVDELDTRIVEMHPDLRRDGSAEGAVVGDAAPGAAAAGS